MPSSATNEPWLHRLLAWFRRLLFRPAALTSGSALALPSGLRQDLEQLKCSGVVRDTVASATQDYSHLREVINGPGSSGDIVDDVTVLAEAEALLRDIIARAPGVDTLARVATDRQDDRPGREAAGDAILRLRDDAKPLHDAASAALRWAAGGSSEDRDRFQQCSKALCRPRKST